MSAKTLKHGVLSRRGLVSFYATSPRLAQACRRAAKHDKSLARLVEIKDLLHAAAASHDLGKYNSEFAKVVLSHADDEPSVLGDARARAVVSGAFHLLFTGPATHPDQVVRWMRSTNIRSENRLHVVQVEDMQSQLVAQLLGRVRVAFGETGRMGGIIDARLVDDWLFVRGPMGRMLHVPLESIRALRDQPRAAIRNFTIDPDGSFIEWPDLDVHLGWDQFLQAVDPAELRKAQQRTAGFNERYGAAVRTVREQAGILQSRIEGLTERQLRRIEKGECRATTAAINALAKAHGLDPNAYMESLAKAMR